MRFKDEPWPLFRLVEVKDHKVLWKWKRAGMLYHLSGMFHLPVSKSCKASDVRRVLRDGHLFVRLTML